MSASHGDNRAAVERLIEHAEPPVRASAHVQAVRSLADAVDAEPLSDELWREYRFALRALAEVLADGGDDEAESALDDVRAAVLHAPEA